MRNLDKIRRLAGHLRIADASEIERRKIQAEKQPRDEHGRFIAYDPSHDIAEENAPQPGEMNADDLLRDVGSVSMDEIDKILGLKKSEKHNDTVNQVIRQAAGQIKEHGKLSTVKVHDNIHNSLSSYKQNNHSPEAGVLKYLVHRLENVSQYNTPDGAKKADQDFLHNREQSLRLARVDASHKNYQNQKDLPYLHSVLIKAPHLLHGLMENRDALHDHLHAKQQKYENGLHPNPVVKQINGEPHVALFRGLGEGERQKDPVLSSYADVKQQLGGRIKVNHPHWVPMKNVWYSYNLGPHEAHPNPRFPHQNEFLVSPHALKEAFHSEVKPMIAPKPEIKQAPQRKMASDTNSYSERMAKTVEQLQATTKGTFAHPTVAVKPAADPGVPKNTPHIRADSQTEVNFKLEKDDLKSVWWHGSPSGLLIPGSTGIHMGTKQAAFEALTARIGHPAIGEWDGTRKYKDTLLAGKKTLRERGISITGHNMDAPEHDYYPHEHPKKPIYSSSGGLEMSPESTPSIEPYHLVGKMSNSPRVPHPDFKANGYMKGAIKRGNAVSGLYYKNIGEDVGSLSIVVPSANHVQKIDNLKKSDNDPEGQFFVDFPEYSNKKTKAKGGWATWHFTKRELADILRNWDTSAKWEWRGPFKYAVEEGKNHPSVRQRTEVSAPIQQHIKDNNGKKVKDILYHGAGQDKTSHEALKGIANQVDVYDPFQKQNNPKDVWKRDIRELPKKKYDQIHNQYTLNVVKKDGHQQGKEVMQEIHDRLKDDGKAVITVRRDDVCAPRKQPKLVQKSFPIVFPFLHLKKAFSPKAWSRVKDNHSPIGGHVVDTAGHFSSTSVDPEYVAASKDNNDYNEEESNFSNSVSPKHIHDVGTKRYMTKPYHRQPESVDIGRTAMHTMGWATVANRALYDAAGIGDLCEKVQTHVHDHVPVLVHPFETNVSLSDMPFGFAKRYREAGYKKVGNSPYPDKDKVTYGSHAMPDKVSLALQQMGVMDFITHNADRHGNNLMYNKDSKMPLAIDHERSFQYMNDSKKSPAQSFWNLAFHMCNSSGKDDASKFLANTDFKPLAQWWNKSKDKMVAEFHKHTGYIKNDTAKKHITENFLNRVASIDDWAKNHKDSSIFDQWATDDRGDEPYSVDNVRFDHNDYRNDISRQRSIKENPYLHAATQHATNAMEKFNIGGKEAMEYGKFIVSNGIQGALLFYFDAAKRKGVKDNNAALLQAKAKLPRAMAAKPKKR